MDYTDLGSICLAFTPEAFQSFYEISLAFGVLVKHSGPTWWS